MTHKFSELEAKMPPEDRIWVKKEVEKALKELPLNELRNARGLSQKMLTEPWASSTRPLPQWKSGRICISPPCEAT
jgi:hypothetical protein